MTETIPETTVRSAGEQMAITRGVMDLLDSWGLHSEEMMSLLQINGKPRHITRYRHNKALPDSPEVMRRIEYLVRINDALRTTYPTNSSMGKRWLRQRNHLFNKRSPLSMMMGDGEQGMVYVLSRLDCTFAWEQSGSTPI
ncbi:MAG: antitoxin Xre/MbcA/ParS toxin-binding domain-containing protein [Candidatus Thiodiazotropha sp. 6PLUC2]